MGVFKSKLVRPERVATDTVLPLHPMDDTSVNKSFILYLMLRFDDILDPEKLRSSLETLLEHGNWKKLGARLRLNDQGKLEYHIPSEFSSKRPAFTYTHDQRECSIEEDSLASSLPKSTANAVPTIYSGTSKWSSLSHNEQDPTHINDYLYQDRPQLSLHIVSFNDATLVSVGWPHTLLDAMGRAELFKAWILSLNGRVDEVPDLVGVDSDPLANFGKTCVEESAIKPYSLNGFGFFVFVINYILEAVLYPKETSRLVCLPASTLAKMKSQAVSEVKAKDSKAFLSDGDVICAWWTRYAALYLKGKKDRTVVVMNAFGLRSTLASPQSNGSSPLLPEGKPYISNCVQAVFGFVRLSEIYDKPLSHTAHLVRRSLIEQGTYAQQEALAYEAKRLKRHVIYGGSDCLMIVFSNWSKAKFHDIDFSAAVVKRGKGKENRVGRPTYIHTNGYSKGYSTRNAGPILGKDENGNYWMLMTMRDGNWKAVEEAFEKDWGSPSRI
ncbi:hypothetical protein GLAREA_03096 [Glarea lozoyensis ATCC 20868]|uniref:Uncharacterized protein n=1 Tax=Glarea lozoyensis (strain ATCC 20868 / MF5171) TaxID=1116229 RepID=S3CKY5_GLAL2|nr:uncharacterized protein GLAREA_03096 [Glarea lozoyensis ATCC 20868]EPE27182.1 hypothetical protein GLAREA_03096 [Glarea lozoyensis ATCC 20868]